MTKTCIRLGIWPHHVSASKMPPFAANELIDSKYKSLWSGSTKPRAFKDNIIKKIDAADIKKQVPIETK